MFSCTAKAGRETLALGAPGYGRRIPRFQLFEMLSNTRALVILGAKPTSNASGIVHPAIILILDMIWRDSSSV